MTGIGLSALLGVVLNLILPQSKEKDEYKERINEQVACFCRGTNSTTNWYRNMMY